jgi:hypothetical protein
MAGEALAAQRPGHTWAIIASSELDVRLRRQVQQLAARDQALVRFFRSPQEAARFRVPRGGLTLELQQEKELGAWMDELERVCGANAQGLTPELASEGYHISVTYPRGLTPERVRVTALTPAGLHHGLRPIPNLLRAAPDELAVSLTPAPKSISVKRSRRSATATIADFPSFRERGIVEGFYGTPWSHQDRIDILRFEGAHGMDVYYYAPKDDPYHRRLWSDPYPPREFKRLGELVSTAHANFVDFCFAISPGLSMVYSSAEDFAKLTAKLASVGKLGVTCFALFLDDVPPELQHPEDLAKFRTLAGAHTALINKLYDHLKAQSSENRLVVTPTTYAQAWGRRDYIRELGAGVNRDVPMVWTGPDTFSPAITVAQAQEWGEFLKRKPLVWDNFPVNDSEPWRLHLGPLRGREAGLAEATAGYFSNPMNQARASMMPLATVADYLWNPNAYDPERSLAQAVVDQYGQDGERRLAPFLKTYAGNQWDENLFTPLFFARRYPIDISAIQEGLTQLDGALQGLRNRAGYRELGQELESFPSRTREQLAKVVADAAFRRRADGKLEQPEDDDVLEARRLALPLALDGDFGKWQSGTVYTLDQKSQILSGAGRWKGADDFSARAAFAWDESFLYIGVEVTDRNLHQPYSGRGIEMADCFSITLQTAYRKNYLATRATGDEYRIYFSPGNFADVGPSLFSDEDYLPPRNRPHNHSMEIKTAWRKTAGGFSGDIAIPATYFDSGRLSEGYEIGLGFAAQKVVDGARIYFVSKRDLLFPVYLSNPSSYPRVVLVNKTLP